MSKPKRIINPPSIKRYGGQGNPDPENAPFVLCSFAPDDPSLPKPRGGVKEQKKIDDFEQAKLDRTRAFGGLVPERSAFLDRLCRKLAPKQQGDIGYADKDIIP